jgi:hypothetical protein
VHAGKTILVVDDFCTQGNSFEAARAFIRKTGADVICLSWLKTINTDYRAILGDPKSFVPDPYSPVTLTKPVPATSLYYSTHVVDPGPAHHLAQVHARYAGWDWPKGF